MTSPSALAADRGDLLLEAERHVVAAQDELQRLADLAVEERQHARALVDHRHLRAEAAEHRRVLDADHAGADHGHAPRQPLVQVQQPVGVDHVLVVELHVLRPRGVRADGDDDVGRADLLGAVLVGDRDRVLVLELTVAEQQPDAVAAELLAHDLRLRADDPRRTVHQELDRRALAPLGVERVGDVERAPGELVEHCDAQASWRGWCRCGWRRRRGAACARRPPRACRAWRPGWPPSAHSALIR